MRSRLLACLVCAVTAVSLTASVPHAARAAASGASYTTTTLHFDVVVGPDDDTHCDIVADLYRPASATASTPAPAILTTHFFGGWKSDPGQVGIARTFAGMGYVVLSYSGLGFGGSTCRISLADPDWDGKAGSQLVSFLGGSKAATDGTRVDFVRKDATGHDGKAHPDDPRVGMIGVSYGGGTALSVAGSDARVDAIIPIIAWNDLQYSLGPNNTTSPPGTSHATPGVFKREWTDILLSLGIASGVFGVGSDPSRITGCANFQPQVCEGRRQMAHDGFPGEDTVAYLHHSSPSSYLSRIKAPTLLVQGEHDTLFDLQEAVATYEKLTTQGTPVKMIWQSWGHSGGILDTKEGEFSLLAGRIAGTYQGDRSIGWFQRYLRDADVSTGPELAYFRDWVGYSGSSEPAYGTAATFPAGATQRLYLSGSDDLVSSESAVRDGSVTYQNWALGLPTSHTETAGVDGLIVPGGVVPPYDLAGTHAAFTSGPLPDDTDLVGSPTLHLAVSSPTAARSQDRGDAGKLVMFVKLFDVAPSGGQVLVNRMVSSVRVPDVTEPFQVTLPGLVHRFAQGHRLRLVIAATDTAYANSTTVHPVTITTGRGRDQVLELPVAGG
jgi:hypothetical protein